MLSGIWYDLRWQLENYAWGPGTQAESGLDYARRIFVSWTMIASVLDSSAGNGGLPVADDLTAITVLTVDDAIDFDGVGNSIGGDGIVSNGTPHEEAICNAFQELHGVPCGHTNVLAYPLGSRYFAIEASAIGGDPDAEVAFRVVGRATTNPDDPDVTCLNDPHPPHFVGMDGRLVEVIAPELPHFATPATWGEVHVSGAEIVAGASYEVRVYRMEGSTPVFSGVRSAVRARALGDTNGDSFVTIDDILCILAVFSGDLDCVAGHIEGADMAPCVPNGLINVDDIIAVLNGFQGGTLNCLPPC